MANDTHSNDLDRHLSLSPLPYVQAWRGFHARMRAHVEARMWAVIERTIQPEEEVILWPQTETKE